MGKDGRTVVLVVNELALIEAIGSLGAFLMVIRVFPFTRPFLSPRSQLPAPKPHSRYERIEI